MNKLGYIILLLMACNRPDKKTEPDLNIPGQIMVTCLREGVSNDQEVDTVLRHAVTKDSIFFSQDILGNCCGWQDNLRLGAVGDTIRVIDISKDREYSACDCECYFRIEMHFLADFYEQTPKAIMWWRSDRVLTNKTYGPAK